MTGGTLAETAEMTGIDEDLTAMTGGETTADETAETIGIVMTDIETAQEITIAITMTDTEKNATIEAAKRGEMTELAKRDDLASSAKTAITAITMITATTATSATKAKISGTAQPLARALPSAER